MMNLHPLDTVINAGGVPGQKFQGQYGIEARVLVRKKMVIFGIWLNCIFVTKNFMYFMNYYIINNFFLHV